MKLPSAPASSRLVRSFSGVFAPPRQSIVRPVSQVLIRLQSSGTQSAFDKAQGIVLNWMSTRAGRTLPNHAWEGQSFTIDDIGAQRTEAVAIREPGYWAARLDDNDKAVAQRVWTTEIALGEDTGGTVILGSRLQCVGDYIVESHSTRAASNLPRQDFFVTIGRMNVLRTRSMDQPGMSISSSISALLG